MHCSGRDWVGLRGDSRKAIGNLFIPIHVVSGNIVLFVKCLAQFLLHAPFAAFFGRCILLLSPPLITGS